MKKGMLTTLPLLGFLQGITQTFIYLLPITIVTYYFFLKYLIESNSLKQSFGKGWLFGFGFFIGSMHWIISPFLIYEKHFLLSPVALFFPLLMAFFFSVPALLVYFTEKYLKIYFKNSVLITSYFLAIFFLFSEFLRSKIFGGLPFNLIAHNWSFHSDFTYIVKYVGVFGLSFITFIWIFLVSLFFINKKNKLAILILIIIPTFLFSLKFFLSNDKQKQTNENIIVRVVQPNISQKEKWDRLSFENNLEKLIKLSIKDNKEDIEKIVVWPEVALTFFLNEEKELVEYISERIPNNITIITGALRREFTGLNFKIYNSMFVIKDGVSSYYDKKKLVPFGEFVPFRGFLNLFKLTPGSSDFSEGIKDNRMYITINEKKISIEPSICYEAIFQTFGNNNSNFMINATNDAWFGKTTGPRQHLAAQVIRSVEKSVYFLRSSNSGISVIADNNGEILKKIELKKEGFLELKLPLHSHVTIFEKYGSTSFLIFLIILFLLFCLIEILISLKRKEYFK